MSETPTPIEIDSAFARHLSPNFDEAKLVVAECQVLRACEQRQLEVTGLAQEQVDEAGCNLTQYQPRFADTIGLTTG